MYLYNSATRKKEEFVPNNPELVKMYTCGPTVYHYAHIGNLRSYIMEDVLEKTLRYLGYPVKRVMNITDVGHLASDADTGEDKMLKGAKRENKSVLEIAKFYTDAFFSDCQKLNIKRPDVVEPATHCIDDIRPAATSTSTPPSWSGTISSTITTWKTWPSASARAWRRTATSATRTTSSSGSPSPNLKTRPSNGTPPGAWAIPAGTSNAPASP